MKQWEKDILERQTKNESVAVWQLEKVYNKAHQDSLEKLAMLKGMELSRAEKGKSAVILHFPPGGPTWM